MPETNEKPGNMLDSLLEALPEPTRLTGDIDVSRIFDQPEGTLIFSYEDLSIAQLHRAYTEAGLYQKRNPRTALWPDVLLQNMITLALAHKAPMPEKMSRADLYATIIEKKGDHWFWLLSEFKSHFPHIFNIAQAAEEKKSEAGI